MGWFKVRRGGSLAGCDGMGVCYSPRVSAVGSQERSGAPRHTVLVRVTHWLTVAAFLALLVSGLELVVSHPRFYWGEVGNVMTRPAFTIPIPSSRGTVPTGYSYTLPDQNGWSRYLHFEAAWLLVLTGLIYGVASVWNGHFRKDLFLARREMRWSAFRERIGKYLRGEPADEAEASSYNVLQRTAYMTVIFVLIPLMIWTGLALSPAFDSAVPAAVDLLGGRQSARTLHFLATGGLVAFVVVHVGMVIHAGFRSRMRAMTTGGVVEKESV
jgi:thiosulfate reductase cytochrome b subunit